MVHGLGSLAHLVQAQAATVPTYAGNLKWFSQTVHAAPGTTTTQLTDLSTVHWRGGCGQHACLT
jgi:hypothetical protein